MKRLVVTLSGCLLALFLLGGPGRAAGADDAVGSVVAVRGEVKASNAGLGERQLVIKAGIFQNDTIRTGKDGRVQLLFADNTIISLGANTVMEIAKYAWDPQQKTGTMKTRVEEGTFRVLGGLITKSSPQNFSTETPAAVIGIRGSMYAGSLRHNRLQVMFLGGRGIFVRNQHGQIDIDTPGFGTRVTPGAPPEPPLKLNGLDSLELLEGTNDQTTSGNGETGGDTGLAPENAELLDSGTGGVTDTTTVTFAENAGADAVVDNTEDELVEEVVEPDGPPPAAVADSLATQEDVPLLIAVNTLLANDDDTPAFSGIVTAPGNGQLHDNGNGTYSYQPDANFNGTDDFTYSVTYQGGVTSVATVDIAVAAVNDAPVAQSQAFAFPEDASLQGAVSFADADGNPLAGVSVDAAPGSGVLTMHPDGSFTYTPAANFNGTDSFTYTVFDGQGGTATATATLNVAPVNDAPVALDHAYAIDEDTPLAGAVSYFDLDGNPLAGVSVTAPPSSGQLTINSDGSFTYIPAANFSGTDSFSYTVSDGQGGTATATATVTVAPLPETAAMVGQSQLFLRRLSDGVLEDIAQQGLTAMSVDGVVSPQLADTTVLPAFTMPAYNPAGPYTSWGFWVENEPVTVVTELGPIPSTRDIAWDNKGEFFLYEINYDGMPVTAGGVDYRYQLLGFGGVPATTLPTTGIDTYTGEVLESHLLTDGGGLIGGGAETGALVGTELIVNPYPNQNFMDDADLFVNWANGRVLGTIRTYPMATDTDAYPVDHVHFYGDINAGAASFRFVTGEGWTVPSDPYDIQTVSGTATFAQFYGSEYQGFGFAAVGTDYNVYDMAVHDQWQAAGGFFREPAMTEYSPTGSLNWNGFYIGQVNSMDNMSDPYYAYSWTKENTDSADFTLTLDAAAGTVTGSLAGMPIGGAGMSAYVDDERFIAEFTPGSYDVDVQSPGSFLVTAAPWHQFSDYASWGYWNLAYSSDGTYHVHSPGAFWVAGQKTPTTDIGNLVTAAYTGTYTGPAYGVRIDPLNLTTPLTGGYTDLTFDFGSSWISGEIGFQQAVLPIGGPAALNGHGFTASNVVTAATSSSLAGGFFGPNAETLAGSFKADVSGNRYLGIFGGNLGGTSAGSPGPD